MITNNSTDVREGKQNTGLTRAGAVLKPEIFFRIDAAAWRQVVTRVAPGKGPKPAESMMEETLVRRAAQSLKLGYWVVAAAGSSPARKPAA